MTEKITNTQYYENIADAIREYSGSSDTYTPSQMAGAIRTPLIELPDGTIFRPLEWKQSFDLSIFKTTNVTNMSGMFNSSPYEDYRWSRITILDISNFTFNNVSSYTDMFGTSSAGIPDNCLIYVKSQTEKDWINTNFPRLTNVQIKVV